MDFSTNEENKHSRFNLLWMSCLIVFFLFILILIFYFIQKKTKICLKIKNKNLNEVKLESFKKTEDGNVPTISMIEKNLTNSPNFKKPISKSK